MAETIIKEGVFSQGPSPYVSAFHMGREHASQKRMFEEKARLQQMEMALRMKQNQLELQEKWKMLREQLAQEREIEDERTKRTQASEKTRRSEHKEEMDLRRAMLELTKGEKETPEERRQRELDELITKLTFGRSMMQGPLSAEQMLAMALMSPKLKASLQGSGMLPQDLQLYYLQQALQGQGMSPLLGQMPVAGPPSVKGEFGDWIQSLTGGWEE